MQFQVQGAARPRTVRVRSTLSIIQGLIQGAGSYRDAYTSLLSAGLPPGHLFGCSTQPPSVHAELSARLHLPYALLSDEQLGMQQALSLPTFEWQGKTLIRRLTLAVEKGAVVKVWYPVFPSDKIADVLDWLKGYTGRSDEGKVNH